MGSGQREARAVGPVRAWLVERKILSARNGSATISDNRFPQSVDSGTRGLVSGEVVIAVIASAEDTDAHRGKLREKL